MARQCGIDRRPGPFGRALSAQAARPRGMLGRLLGRLWIHETAALNDEAIALLAAQPGDAVLEIGCGPGRTVATLGGAEGDGDAATRGEEWPATGRLRSPGRRARRELGVPRRLDPHVYRGPSTDQLTEALHTTGFVESTVHTGRHTSVVLAGVPGG